MITQTRAPSDIVAVLLFLTGENVLLADPHRLHRAVEVAQQRCSLLQRFVFTPTGPQTMSRSLDEALALLKLSRVVRMENTDYERYMLDEQARKYINDVIVPRFSAEEQKSLAGAAAIVKEECGSSASI